jgi:tetratricopeptide (TPR) repeat protein
VKTSRNSTNLEIVRRADELYAQREQIENVCQSIEILRGSAGEARSFEVNWRLGRAYFFLGQEALSEASNEASSTTACKDAALAYHSRGIMVCQQASSEETGRVEGHFWLGVNLALAANNEQWFLAIRDALRAKRTLRRAAQIDSAYHGAGPLRVLARLDHKLPPWLGGNLARARGNYEEAVGLAPENTVTRVYFAELLLGVGEKDSACSHLESVLSIPDDVQWAFEIRRDRRIAKEMLARLWQSNKIAKRVLQ